MQCLSNRWKDNNTENVRQKLSTTSEFLIYMRTVVSSVKPSKKYMDICIGFKEIELDMIILVVADHNFVNFILSIAEWINLKFKNENLKPTKKQILERIFKLKHFWRLQKICWFNKFNNWQEWKKVNVSWEDDDFKTKLLWSCI